MKKEAQGKFKQPQKVPTPKTSGYPEKDVKTTGIKIRGTGAATKGTYGSRPNGIKHELR
jgi:hypothetical protein